MTRGVVRLFAAVAAVVCGACSIGTQDRAEVASDRSVPFALLDPDAPPIVPTTVAGPAAEDVAICFVREGRLVTAIVKLQPPVAPEDAIAALASPPDDAPGPLRTALADPLAIRTVGISAGIARVDLAASITQLGGDDQLLAVAQIVCTLTALPGIGQVSFAVEGTPVEVPRADGSLVAQPLSRDDYASLLG